MEFRDQNNHTVAARVISDRLPRMSQQRPLTGNSISSWSNYKLRTGNSISSGNNYKQYYSGRFPDAPSPMKTNFYEDEYKKMVSRMDQMMSKKFRSTGDPFGELVQLSVLADGDNFSFADNPNPIPPQSPWERKAKVSISCMLKWKRCQDEKHEVFMTMMKKLEEMDEEYYRRKMLQRKPRSMGKPIGEFLTETLPKETEGNYRMGSTSEGDSSMESMPVGDFMRSSGPEEDFRIGSMQEEDVYTPVQHVPDKEVKSASSQKVPKSTKKEKLAACRHFAKGWCRQGDACSFQHCVKDSYPTGQKVFLGGLPQFITSSKLVEELGKQGYEVVNEPKIFRGFSPQVCLATNAGAMKLLKERKITICGCKVEIRPYKAVTKKERDRQLDINKRSVFLGGLPSSVTVQVLKASIG